MNINNYVKGYNNELSIIDNCIQLYKKTNNEETLEHVIRVSKTGIDIANNYDLDKSKVEIACYLHDISKIISKEDYVELCESYGMKVLDVEREIPLVLHQKVSRLIAERIFNIIDEEILSSLESHTTLRGNPSDIDMVVFIADKISWDKEGNPPYYDLVNESIRISLEKACLDYINYRIDNNMISIPHPMLIEAKGYLESLNL